MTTITSYLLSIKNGTTGIFWIKIPHFQKISRFAQTTYFFTFSELSENIAHKLEEKNLIFSQGNELCKFLIFSKFRDLLISDFHYIPSNFALVFSLLGIS